MSDLLGEYCRKKFTQAIHVSSEHCLSYVRQQSVSGEDICFTVEIPFEILKDWKVDAAQSLTFVDLLNACIPGESFKIKSERIENRLRVICSEVQSKFKGKNGAAFRKNSQMKKRLSIRHEDLVKDDMLEKKVEELTNNNEELHARCQELYEELAQSRTTEAESLGKLEKANVDLATSQQRNHKLHEYVEKLEQFEYENTGKPIADLGERQRYRKLRELKTRTQQAMWFVESFGLSLDTLSMKDGEGMQYTLSYAEESRKQSFANLPEEEQEKVKQILFILDKFCISEAAYHEITMLPEAEGLPKSYLVRQCKENLNGLCHIERTPGSAPGAQLDFEQELRIAVQKCVAGKSREELSGTKLQIKISGDGAKMTRLTNFILLSFSILNEGEEVMSSKGNYTVAVIKAHESYDVLKSSGANIWAAVNKLLEAGKISIRDGSVDVQVNFFLGGDYKFLLLVMGMKGATSHHACVWCKIHKKDRHDMSLPMDYYWGEDVARTLQDVKDCAKKNLYSCQHCPLLNIPLGNVVLDELHLMLRVTDVLTKNLIAAATEWDSKDNHNKSGSQAPKKHLHQIVTAIKECGVCFNVWEKMNADGRTSGLYDWTSLMGSETKLLLKHLPPKLKAVCKPEIGETVSQIWEDFGELYATLSKWELSEEEIKAYFTKANRWVSLFLSLSGQEFGHIKAAITPYIHSMVYHVPLFMTRHKGIKKFTGQGVEKNNDDARKIHLLKSNKWDAAKDVLQVSKRMTMLQDCERTPTTYTKRNADYWAWEIKEKRSQRKRICTEAPPVPEVGGSGDPNFENLSSQEIRDKLKALGTTTRVRNRVRLLELLRDALDSS